ncbi:hypothetical protein [Pantoea sp. R13S299]|uniref:hypothetical protein n=1 Tax=Pantoea sp. R13S299 TaxID=3402751 RepID=UPI003AE6EB51
MLKCVSLLSGESVMVIAGRDLTVTGSAVAADRDVSLQAGRDVEIVPAFGEAGGGIQILPNMQERVNVEWLLKNE